MSIQLLHFWKTTTIFLYTRKPLIWPVPSSFLGACLIPVLTGAATGLVFSLPKITLATASFKCELMPLESSNLTTAELGLLFGQANAAKGTKITYQLMRDKGHTSYFKLTLKLEIIFDLIDCKDSWGCNWLESTGPTQHLGEPPTNSQGPTAEHQLPEFHWYKRWWTTLKRHWWWWQNKGNSAGWS